MVIVSTFTLVLLSAGIGGAGLAASIDSPPHGVVVRQDVAYGPKPAITLAVGVTGQTMHVCSPEPQLFPGLRPALVLLHGGGWGSGSASNARVVAHCFIYAQHGIAVFDVNYTLASSKNDPGTAPWPAQIQDVLLALSHVRRNAGLFNIDPKRLCVQGDSAGGHLALWAGILAHGSVACVVDEFGPTNLLAPPFGSSQIARAWRAHMWMPTPAPADCSNLSDPYCAASPLYFAARLPSTMVVFGTEDTVVVPRQSTDLISAARAAQVAVATLSYPGGHEFSGLSPGQMQKIRQAEVSFLTGILLP